MQKKKKKIVLSHTNLVAVMCVTHYNISYLNKFPLLGVFTSTDLLNRVTFVSSELLWPSNISSKLLLESLFSFSSFQSSTPIYLQL